MNIEDIPITMKGAARYNIANCLNAISLAKMLNLSNSAIRDALSRFGGSFRENPGRGNFIHIDGVTVLMDFAHNPHGMKAIIEMIRQVPARRRLILVGQAGDRSNGDIRALVEATAVLEFDRVIAAEIPKYLRGRESGEVPGLIRSAFEELGIRRDDVELSPDYLSGVRSALEWSQSGDLLLLLVLDQKEEVFEFIRSRETS
jgi:UDP-N-acetylmuramyl tripeptide synthase